MYSFPGGPLHGIHKNCPGMPAVDQIQSPVMHGLQAELQPDMLFLRISLKQPNHGIGNTIGTRPHGKADDVLLRQGLVIEALQVVQRTVRARKGLKIGNEFDGSAVFSVIGLTPCNLFRNRGKRPRLAQP